MPAPVALNFVGVDGGGTGTRARLTDKAGCVQGEAEAGPSSLRLGGDAAAQAVVGAVEGAFRAARLPLKFSQTCIGIGIAGFSFTDARKRLAQQLQRAGFARVAIEGDQVTAWRGAHGGADGGIVIVGTGSNAYGRIGAHEVQIGGHGFPISDAGSGACIGLAAVRAALSAHDGVGTATPLSADILKQLGGSPNAAIGWAQHATATDYAALARSVVHHAETGDPLAQRLLQDAASDVAQMVAGLFKSGVPRVSLLGGLAQTIQTHMPPGLSAHISPPHGDALDGALMAAHYPT